MSSGEKQRDTDILGAAEDASEDENSKDAVLRDDEDEESSDEDIESEDEDDGEEEENGDEEVDSTADVEDEDVSEEGDTEDEEDGEEDDSEEDEEDEVEDEQGEELDNADMSSGDENSDRCPICLNGLRNQDIGTPESCDHSFCLECIQEWAKNVNTCPVDRHIFRIILARHAGEEKIFKQFPVEDKQQEKEEEEDDPTYCEVCGQSNREDRLLLCDRCDLGYHCDCLDPPLASVPVHEWFCPDCHQDRNTDSEPLPSGRQIARTRVSERVRRLIAEARAERAERRRRIGAMIAAQDAQENEEAGPSASVTTVSPAKAERKKMTRKRKTTRRKTTRRKTKKKRKTSKKTGKKTKTRRKRKSKGKGKRKVRKTKKSSSGSPALARTAFFRTATSVKGRIADKLGLSKPPAGRSIPMQKLPQSGGRQEGASRSSVDHNPSSFSLLGSRDELYLFADQEGEERQPVNRPAIPAESLLSKSAKSSHRPLSFSLTNKKIVVKEVATNSLHTSPATGGFDLLGSIMQNQDLLHKGSKHVTINRDGSLSAINSSRSLPSAARTATLATGVTMPTQLSSSNDINHSSSTPASPVSQTKLAELTPSPKSKPSKSAHFSLSSFSCSKPTVKSESESDVLNCLTDISKKLNSHSELTAGVSKFADDSSSDEELRTIDAAAYLPLSVKKESKNNCDGTVTLNKASSLMSKAKSANSSLENSFVEGTQTFNAVRTEEETGSNGDTNVHYGVSLADNCNEDVFNSNRSSSNSAALDNGAKFLDSFADKPVTELESKASIGSESLSNGTDHNLSSNNSHEVGSRGESDSILTANANDSSRIHSLDVNSGVDLEADAVFSNNARLNAEEDIGNNSIGFSRTTSSLTNLRNFAAVARDLNNVHDESLSAMKRNFNLLVSTRSNLAGYESGEENDNIEGFIHLPNDREEGEASDSNEEGEVREFEDRQGTADEQEEGEIVDEEERDRWALGRNVCEENNEEGSGGLDVNAIHIEEMEIGTFRKRSMSQNEDANNEGSKKIKIEEDTPPDTEAKQNSGNEEGTSEEDGNNGGRSFMLSNLLTNLKTNDIDRKLDNDEKGVEEEEEAKENEDLTMKPISILDFIGDASAKKFGLPVVEKDFGRADHNFGQQRGSANFAGGNNFGYRGSRSSYTNRRHSHKQRERNDDDMEDGRMEMEAIPPRLFDRRRGSWQEEDRSRQRSGSQESQGANERAGSYDVRSSKLHHGRKKESGKRRRDDEGRDRSRKSRSPSGSPRRTEKRRRPMEHEGKNRHSKKGKRSRWNHEDEDQDSNEEENVEKPDEEVKKKNESRGLSTVQSNGHPPSRAPEIQQHSSGHYQSHQYPSGVAAFSYSGTPAPPLTSSHPPAPPSHPPPPPPPPLHPHPSYPNTQVHPHLAHPGHSFNHTGQPPYSQLQHRFPVQQTVQTRHPQHHQGYQDSYYPQPHPASLVQKPPPPPPPQPYPHPVYPVCYPSQPRQPAAAIAHPNAHMPAANQPHSGYPPRYPPPVTHPYPPPVPHAAYPPRPLAQSTTTSAVFTTTATPVYPPQQLVSTSTAPAIPRQSFNTVLTPQEPSMPRTAANLNQDSKIVVTNPPPPIPETRKSKGTVKESASSGAKSARTSYPTSPPTAPIKGVTTYDKVDSSILLNEVKKGFRQLVEDAVRSALRGAWRSKKITKEEYKDIFKRAVEKVCASKETVVNQEKIQSLVNAYVMKSQKARKVMQTSK